MNAAPHVLHFRFPACELLCDNGILPVLPEPAFAEYRDQPFGDQSVMCTFSTDFYAVLDSTLDKQLGSDLPNLGPLFKAINALHSTRGESELQYAEGKLHPDDLYYKHAFRLVTMDEGIIVNTQQWILVSAEVMHLYEPRYRSVQWVATFLHLIERKSDVACYHVANEMLKFFDPVRVEGELAGHPWSTTPPRTAQQVLLARLCFDNFGLEPCALHTVSLQCQHHVPNDWPGFDEIELWSILNLRCPICATNLLSDEDVDEIEFCRENVVAAREFLQANAQWTILTDHPHGLEFSVHPEALRTSIELALASLAPPTLVMPSQSSMDGDQSAQVAVKHLRALCDRVKSPLLITPQALFTDIQQQIWGGATSERMSLAQSFIRPGYAALVRGWCARAVNFLVKCRCDEPGPLHLGVHLHGNRQLYNPAAWTTVDDINADLDKLTFSSTRDCDMDS